MALYERHLTGEESFQLQGVEDSILTRYTFSNDISKAHDYIRNKLQRWGYAVESQPFFIDTYYDISFAPASTDSGWLTTSGKIYATADGGQSWNLQYENLSDPEIWSVFPLNNQRVFAVGNNGLFVRTSAGGSNWQVVSTPTYAFLFGVYFIDSTTGWICGDNGLILKTTTGGDSWSIKNTPITSRLYDIFFVNSDKGWAVGRNGHIIATVDGGETWNLQTTPTITRLYGLHFPNDSTGVAVGWLGTVLRTENSGATWSNVSVPTSEYLYDIDFINETDALIAGWDGTCLKSGDGGNNWTVMGNILNKDAYGLDYLNGSLAWCSGRGVIAHTEDGAASWAMIDPASNLDQQYNVIAVKTGTTYPDTYYLMGAHYDDTSENPMIRAPGADDNASGTSAVLEAARILAPYDFKYSLKFILFSAEEQGLIGSAYYADSAAAAGEQIQGMINLDMIGYDSNGDGTMEIHAGTMGSSQNLGLFVYNNVNNWNLPLQPIYKTSNSSGASDHSSFWNAGYPAIMMIEDHGDFTPYYHTTGDLLSTLNLNFMLNNARLATGSLALLAEPDTQTGIISSEVVPKEFRIGNPYPNPFNPVTTLNYSVPQEIHIQILVYNTLGQVVDQLYDGWQSAGTHTFRWNAGNSSSGIYYIQIKSEQLSETKKVLLLR